MILQQFQIQLYQQHLTLKKLKLNLFHLCGFSTAATYYYWQAQYNMRNGKVGIATQIDPTGAYSTSGARVGIANTIMGSFNDLNHNTLSLKRSDTNHGILIYRQNFGTDGTASMQ